MNDESSHLISYGRVLYDYQAQEDDELNVQREEIIELLHLNEDNWWIAKKCQQIGLIPANYVQEEISINGKENNIPAIQSTPLKADIVRVPLPSRDDYSNSDELKRIMEQRLQADAKIESLRKSLSTAQRGWESAKPLKPIESINNNIQLHTKPSLSSKKDINSHNSMDHIVSIDEHTPITTTTATSDSLPMKPIKSNDNSSTKPRDSIHKRSHVEIVEGIRYTGCKSIVYCPSTVPTTNLSIPSKSLILDHINGYTWNNQHYYPNISPSLSKSIVISIHGYIIFRVSSIVVIMKQGSSKQRFFTDHDDIVTSLAIHPSGLYVASSQKSLNGKIFVWNIRHTISQSKDKKTSTILLKSNISHKSKPISSYTNKSMLDNISSDQSIGVISLDFSGDGKLLLAMNDEYELTVFDWSMSSILRKTKIDHPNLTQLRFNSLSYSIIQGISKHQTESTDDCNLIIANYPIVSVGGGIIKFWTFNCISSLSSDSSSINKLSFNHSDVKKRSKGKRNEIFELNHCDGTIPKNHGLDSIEFTDIAFLPMNLDHNLTTNNEIDDGNSNEVSGVKDNQVGRRSIVLTSTSSGGVFLWEQLLQENTKQGHSSMLDHSMTHNQCSEHLYWSTKSRLISVVLDMHSSPITKILHVQLPCIDSYDYNEELLITSSKDGIISFWNIHRSNDNPIVTLTKSSIEDQTINEPSISQRTDDSIVIESTQAITEIKDYIVDISWSDRLKAIVFGSAKCCIHLLNLSKKISIPSSSSSETSQDHHEFIVSPTMMLMNGNKGIIHQICEHPTLSNIFATITSESINLMSHGSLPSSTISPAIHLNDNSFKPQQNSVRIHDSIRKCVLAEVSISGWVSTSIVFVPYPFQSLSSDDHRNMNLILGSDDGEIILLSIHIDEESNSSSYKIIARKRVAAKERTASATMKTMKGITKGSIGAVSIMKFSPNGSLFAVVCQGDKLVHILSTTNQFKRVAVCRGHQHTITISSIDISKDSLYIQGNDPINHEILYWEIETGKLLSDGYALRDVTWATWSCVYGFPVQGLASNSPSPKDTSIQFSRNRNRVNGNTKPMSRGTMHLQPIPNTNDAFRTIVRSHDETVLIVSEGSFSDATKLYRYPCLLQAQSKSYRGHVGGITGAVFVVDDSIAITTGRDQCVMQWKVVNDTDEA